MNFQQSLATEESSTLSGKVALVIVAETITEAAREFADDLSSQGGYDIIMCARAASPRSSSKTERSSSFRVHLLREATISNAAVSVIELLRDDRSCEYSFVWFMEDTVFVPLPSTLASMDHKYADVDLLFTRSFRQDVPVIFRLSRAFLNSPKLHVEEKAHVTVSAFKDLLISCVNDSAACLKASSPNEMSWGLCSSGRAWTWEDLDPYNVFEPVPASRAIEWHARFRNWRETVPPDKTGTSSAPFSDLRFVVYVQVKDEDELLPFFVEHYVQKLGFHHIFVVDDNSKTPVSDLVSKSQWSSTVTSLRIDFDTATIRLNSDTPPCSTFFDSDVIASTNNSSRQIYNVRLFLKRFWRDAGFDPVKTWILFVDADEFLCLPPRTSISQYISRCLVAQPDMRCLYLRWCMFGTSHHPRYPRAEDGRPLSPCSCFLLSQATLDTCGKSLIRADAPWQAVRDGHLMMERSVTPSCHGDLEILDYTSWTHRPVHRSRWREIAPTFGGVSAFIAHYVTLDYFSLTRRKIMRKRAENYDVSYNRQNLNEFTVFEFHECVNRTLAERYGDGEEPPLPRWMLEPETWILDVDEMSRRLGNTCVDFWDLLEVWANLGGKDELPHCRLRELLPMGYKSDLVKAAFGAPGDSDFSWAVRFMSRLRENSNLLLLCDDLPETFDASVYAALNPDLRRANFSEDQLKSHFLLHGREEGRFFEITRPLPVEFTAGSYRSLNPDLADMDDEEVSAHYLCHGWRENRRFV
jgi:hypothetical protein